MTATTRFAEAVRQALMRIKSSIQLSLTEMPPLPLWMTKTSQSRTDSSMDTLVSEIQTVTAHRHEHKTVSWTFHLQERARVRFGVMLETQIIFSGGESCGRQPSDPLELIRIHQRATNLCLQRPPPCTLLVSGCPNSCTPTPTARGWSCQKRF